MREKKGKEKNIDITKHFLNLKLNILFSRNCKEYQHLLQG